MLFDGSSARSAAEDEHDAHEPRGHVSGAHRSVRPGPQVGRSRLGPLSDALRSRRGRLLLNLTLAAASLLAAGGLIELLLGQVNRRESPAEQPHGEMASFTRYHPVLGWNGLPNVRGELLGKVVTQNSRGDRGPEVPFAKPSHTRRVVVLGDSQAWGLGVGDDETIAAQLQARLSAGSTSWQAINLGVSGYGTDQAYLKYVLEGARYEPDAVVLVVFKNDIFENGVTHCWRVEKPRFYFHGEQLCVGNVPPPKSPGWPEDAVAPPSGTVRVLGRGVDLSWSETLRFFRARTWRLVPPVHPEPADVARIEAAADCIGNRTDYQGDGGEILLALVRRLDEQVRAESARLVVLFVPRPAEWKYSGLKSYYDDLRGAMARMGVSTVDLREQAALARVRRDELFLNKRDAHLSAKGSAVAGDAVAEELAGAREQTASR